MPFISVVVVGTVILTEIGSFSQSAAYLISAVLLVVLVPIFSALVAKEIRRTR